MKGAVLGLAFVLLGDIARVEASNFTCVDRARSLLAKQGVLPPGWRSMTSPPGVYSVCASELRTDKLGTESGYDVRVPPSSIRRGSPFDGEHPRDTDQYAQTGTDVYVSIRAYKFQDIDITQGTMQLKTWLRMWWSDPRLAWDPAEYGGLDKTFYVASVNSNLETEEIWSPDIELYNSKTTIAESFDASLAEVDDKGNVYWVRQGSLQVLCKFSDVVNFPDDKPLCHFEMGGWMYSEQFQGIYLKEPDELDADDGFFFDNQEVTSQPSYAQFRISPENGTSATLVNYSYGSNWQYPVILATVRVERVNTTSWELLITFPTIFLACLSILVCFVKMSASERLSFGSA